MKNTIPVAVLFTMLSGSVLAAETATSQPLLNKSNFAIGAGVAHNSIDNRFGDIDDVGFQFFAAYDLDRVNLMDGVNTPGDVLGY